MHEVILAEGDRDRRVPGCLDRLPGIVIVAVVGGHCPLIADVAEGRHAGNMSLVLYARH